MSYTVFLVDMVGSYSGDEKITQIWILLHDFLLEVSSRPSNECVDFFGIEFIFIIESV
jgi:hypothetical protein